MFKFKIIKRLLIKESTQKFQKEETRKAKRKQEILSNHKNKNSFIKGSWTFRIKKKKKLNNREDFKNFKRNLNF